MTGSVPASGQTRVRGNFYGRARSRHHIFGKPLSVTRSGGGKSATRSYVYDAKERLCKTIEPETGATIQQYDAYNNLAWRATGLGYLSTSSCDQTSVPAASKTSFTYDALNRLTNTAYGDGSPAIARTYTYDSLRRSRQPLGLDQYLQHFNTRESLAYGGATYNIDRNYDANGSLSQ